jgi:hypothetical protein
LASSTNENGCNISPIKGANQKAIIVDGFFVVKNIKLDFFI